MKLLLTSGGLTNRSIANALFELVGKSPEQTAFAFIPTAMNLSTGDKSWFINDLQNFKKQNFKFIDIVDISALPKKIWLPRLEAADVLFFSGGNTFHLMHWLKESGLAELLPELLKTRVYGGISAGIMVTNPTLALSSKDKRIYYEENFGSSDIAGLGFVDFYTRPHLNSPDFPQANAGYLKNEVAKNIDAAIYGLDDNSALKVIDGKVEVVSEGDWVKIN